MGLGAKLATVSPKCRYMQKDGRNEFQKYDYVTAASLLGKVNEVLTEQKFFICLKEKYLSTVELEKRLLSALILEGGRAIPVAAEILSPEDFYRPEHRLIYKTLLKLSGEDIPPDVLLVETELRRTDELKKSRGLKCLADDLEIPVLVLSQLNRNAEMRAEKIPQLSDLRDSGTIEQDADVVTLLHSDEYYSHDNSKQAKLIIAKNRNGGR